MGYKKRQLPRLQRSGTKKFTNKQYTTHLKFMYTGIVCLIFGFKFKDFFVIAVLLELSGLSFMVKNWKRINDEYEQGKKVKKK